MKQANWFAFLLLVSALTSCKEEYKSIDPQKFNKKLSTLRNIKTAKQLIEAYDTTLVKYISYPGRLSIDTLLMADNKMEITAIVNINDDDELAGDKYVMIMQRKGILWNALEIRHNWKYQDGYGHTDWGI